jgi:hypothetical protein
MLFTGLCLATDTVQSLLAIFTMFRLNMDSFVMFKTNRTNAKLVTPFHVWSKFLSFLSCVPFSDIILYEVGNKHTLFIDMCCKQGWSENAWRNNSESCRNHGEVSNPDANWIQRFVFHELTFRNILHPSCYGSVTTSINFSYIFSLSIYKMYMKLNCNKMWLYFAVRNATQASRGLWGIYEY